MLLDARFRGHDGHDGGETADFFANFPIARPELPETTVDLRNRLKLYLLDESMEGFERLELFVLGARDLDTSGFIDRL